MKELKDFILNYPIYNLIQGGGQFDWDKEEGQKILMVFEDRDSSDYLAMILEIESLVKHREWPISDDPQEFEGKTEIEIISATISTADYLDKVVELSEDDRTELEYIVYQNL